MSNRRKRKPTGRKFPQPRDRSVTVTVLPDLGRVPTVEDFKRHGKTVRGLTFDAVA